MASRRNLLLVAGLVGLIGLVAVAARGHAPTGTGGSHGVGSHLIFEFVLLAFVAMFIISLPLAVWIMFSARTYDPHGLKKRRQRSLFRSGVLVGVGLAFLIYWWIRREYFHSAHTPKLVIPSLSKSNQQIRGHAKPVPFDWLPAIVVIVIAVIASAVIAYLMFRKGPKRVPTQAEIALELTTVLDDSLDDLRSELDPRKAVIATYARMERTLARFGFPRAEAEAPFEYLGRILRDLLQTSADAVSRLTSLFERAKFSPHTIDPGMKNDAIEALVAVRDELRAAVP
jgi:Domain of unknown function (DUF4129)